MDSATGLLPGFPVPVVDIEENGTYKYVLIEVSGKPPNILGNPNVVHIVRGNRKAGYHADLVDEFEQFLVKNNLSNRLRVECTGGGRIKFKKDQKKISIYGYSVGYGQANHEITCQLLKKHFTDYTVDWSNAGY